MTGRFACGHSAATLHTLENAQRDSEFSRAEAGVRTEQSRAPTAMPLRGPDGRLGAGLADSSGLLQTRGFGEQGGICGGADIQNISCRI